VQANVIGTTSKQPSVSERIGVNQVIDYTTTPFESVAKNVDAVFDTVGGDTLQRSWMTLKPGGILLSIVEPPSQETADKFGVRQQFVGYHQAGGELLAKFAAMLDTGKLKVTVSKVLPLSEAQNAHSMVEGRHTLGKLVMKISQ
jgi:NADPH:quinone reductase-like Zn-dependent oxidoreductase